MVESARSGLFLADAHVAPSRHGFGYESSDLIPLPVSSVLAGDARATVEPARPVHISGPVLTDCEARCELLEWLRAGFWRLSFGRATDLLSGLLTCCAWSEVLKARREIYCSCLL